MFNGVAGDEPDDDDGVPGDAGDGASPDDAESAGWKRQQQKTKNLTIKEGLS